MVIQEGNLKKNNNKACCTQERESRERLCDWTMWSSFLSPDNHLLSLSLEVRTVGLKGQHRWGHPQPRPTCLLTIFHLSNVSKLWDRTELELPGQRTHMQKNDGCSRLGWGHDSAHWEKSAFLWASIHLSIKWEIITLAVLIVNLKYCFLYLKASNIERERSSFVFCHLGCKPTEPSVPCTTTATE